MKKNTFRYISINSLKTKILVVSLILLLCLIITFALYSIFTTRAYQLARLDGIRKTIKFETERANKLISEVERGAIQLATSGFLYQISQSDIIGEFSALEFLRSFPIAIGGGFWFEPYSFNEKTYRKGVHAYYDRETHKVCLDNIEDDYDYHELDWYKDILSGLYEPFKVTWIEPYLDDTTFKLVITAGAGIYDEANKLIGLSAIDLEIDGVLAVLSSIKPSENSIVLLFDSEHGHILMNTHADTDSLPEITNSSPSEVRVPFVIDYARKTWQNIYEVSVSVVMIENVTYISMARMMNNGWHLIVYTPTEEIFLEADQRNKFFSILIAMVVTLILFLAYYMISNIIYKPIKKLTSSVAQISLGNLDIRAESFSKDELGMLAKAFNKMTNDLQVSINAYTLEHAEKERIGAELSIAADIQTGMLPCIFPPFPDRSEFDIFAIMHPAKEVGGDFYDFFFVENNILAVVIADVSGKGVPASLFMVITKILIENNAYSYKSPAEVLTAVNKTLCENNDTGMFVTVFIGYYDLLSRRFVYVNAGHNPPLILKGSENGVPKRSVSFEYLKSKPSKILGWQKNSVYKEEELTLEEGDILYLYTDGVTEAMNSEGELFNEKRLQAILNKTINKTDNCSLCELLSSVKQEITDYANAVEQADDITMLVLKVNK